MIIKEGTMAELELSERMPDMENEDDARAAYRLFCAEFGHRLLK